MGRRRAAARTVNTGSSARLRVATWRRRTAPQGCQLCPCRGPRLLEGSRQSRVHKSFLRFPIQVVSPFFAFALPFFAIALNVFDRKEGWPKIEQFQASTASRPLENNSDEPRRHPKKCRNRTLLCQPSLRAPPHIRPSKDKDARRGSGRTAENRRVELIALHKIFQMLAGNPRLGFSCRGSTDTISIARAATRTLAGSFRERDPISCADA
jgi:hypothetical protein